MTETTTLATQANSDLGHADEVIQSIYKQVFGNRHLMELDVNKSLEALFMNGDLSVQGFVTALAQSDTYKKLFLDDKSPYQFVELNFKHLLGRPPHDQQELMEHVTRMNTEGYEAEIASYTYSEEYLAAFGIDRVPHNRSSESISGGRTINYTRGIAVDAGFAGYDAASNGSKLLSSLSTGNTPAIVNRKSVGNANGISIFWTTSRQVSANRRVMQKSVVSQSSMSATLRSIQAQGGRIVSISKA